jgi:hypothetical protein
VLGRTGLWLALLLMACPGGAGKTGSGARAGGDLSVFLISELKGTIEPCGCNSDPLGDLSRTAEVLDQARAERPVLFLDGGSTLYTELKPSPYMKVQEELKSDLLEKTLPAIGLAGSGLGPYDLVAGPDKVRPARHAANVTGIATVPPAIHDVGGVKVGVFGVVDPDAVPGLRASDPAEAARTAISKLRADGAQFIVALAHMPRAKAKKLAKDAPGADFVLIGQDLGDAASPVAEAVGSSYLIAPANRGQVLARLDLHLDAAAGALTDAIGPERATAEVERLEERIVKLSADLEKWRKDPTADPAFVKRNEEELTRMKGEQQTFRDQPMRAPKTGSWFVLRTIPIKKRLACDPQVVAAKVALDRSIGQANLKAGAGEKPEEPAPGKPHYVGIEECAMCHRAAVDFWKETRHAQAWKTLTEREKHLNRECTGCHVTGWQSPGGATLARLEGLTNVQCETCHGPGSVHVDADGKDSPKTVVLRPADNLCAGQCHTPEHSDTFQLEAYLRDVTGPGHGQTLRAKLGEGPTGRALRQAALDKAGRELGEGCPR